MKIIIFLTFLYVLLNCNSVIDCASKSRSKGKQGKKGKSGISFGGDFLGDITPPPNEVYNLHIDLSKTNELQQFSMSDIKKINNTLTLLYEEHNNDMKYFEQIMNVRQQIIDHLIDEVKKLKLNTVMVV